MTAGNVPLVPFTVVGGFLGAGKTTLLNHVLRHTDERLAVLVNDFGSTPIDADLIAAHDGDTIALSNGCICCSIAGDLARTIMSLRAADPPIDRVITEASGVSDPRKVAQYGTTPGFRLDGVIVLADAANIDATLSDERIAAQVATQLERADVIVLNKVDLVDDAQLAATTSMLAERCPAVPVVRADHGAVPLPVLFDNLDRVDRVDRHDRQDGDTAGRTDAWAGTDDLHGFDTATLVTDQPVERSDLVGLAAGLPLQVLRAKGVVADASGALWVVHRVGASVKVSPYPSGVPSPSTSLGRIVMIGSSKAVRGYLPPQPFTLEFAST